VGRTHVDVQIENYDDIVLRRAAGNGHRRVRKVAIRALADTGSDLLCPHHDLPPALTPLSGAIKSSQRAECSSCPIHVWVLTPSTSPRARTEVDSNADLDHRNWVCV
jgi:hypothetical protein